MKKLLKRLAALITVAATLFSVTACEDLLGVSIESDDVSETSVSESIAQSSESLHSTQSGSLEESIASDSEEASIAESEDSEFMEEESDSEEDSESASEEPEAPQQALVYDGSEVTVTFYHTMGARQRVVFEDSLEAFNKLYPNITVVHENMGSASMLREAITYSLMRNEAPSIAFCAPEDLVYYRDQQALFNLNEVFQSEEMAVAAGGKTEMMGFTQAQVGDFDQGFLEAERYFGGGNLYSLPVYAMASVMYYNKTYFETNGLSVPTTWEEMEEVCALIKAKKENCCPLAVDGDADLFITRAEQLGEPYVSATGEKLFNTAKNRAMVEELREWYEKGYLITDGIWGSYTSDLLQSEDAYMSIASAASASWYETNAFEVGVAMIPQENANAKVPMLNTSVCLFKQEDLQETAAAWLLMKHLSTSVEYQAGMSMEYGCVPVIRSVEANAAYREFLEKENVNAKAIKQALSQTSAYFVTPVFEEASNLKGDVRELIIDCLSEALPSGKTAAAFIKEKFDGITQ